MADEQSGELAAMRRIDRMKALGDAADLVRAYTDKFIARELKLVAKRWGRRFLDEALLLKSYATNKNLWLTDPLWPVKNDNGKGNFKDMRGKSKSELSLVPPQAQHHFTLADQVNQLVAAREADPDMGFMGRLLSLCSLPRTNPGDRKEYKRINGPYTLYMIAGGGNRLPYGSLPRLILSWVCTEAVRTQSRDILLGRSLSGFMREIGISSDSGGPRGEQTRFRNQMKRLFGCSVMLIYEDEQVTATVTSPVASQTVFWWDPKRPGERTLWNSRIRLGEDFFNEIISHPVPLDMNTLKALKRSPLGLDLYFWLVYRTFSLTNPLYLSWRQLYRQFGAHPSKDSDKVTVQAFRRKLLRELNKIKAAWPGLNYGTARGELVLYPSKPSIARAQARPLRLAD